MKHFVKPLSASIAAAVLAAASFAPVANAEIAASAGVASMYLWRGIDLGDGSAAVFGDIKYTAGGFYTGVWGSSGDSSLGNEYDLFAGYGLELGGFKVDLSVWNYNYSDLDEARAADGLGPQDDTTGEMSDVILTLGYGPVAFTIYDQVAGGAEDYEYYTLAATFGQFSGKVGFHDYQAEEDGSDMTHVDLSYAYNSNLSFTLSKVVDEQEEDSYDDDLMFVVSYALPIN